MRAARDSNPQPPDRGLAAAEKASVVLVRQRARVARALDVSVEEMFARAGRDAAPSTRAESQGPSPHDDTGPGAVERIRELEERVARTEQEMGELRQLLERQQAGRANVR